MRRRFGAILAAGILCLAASVSWADLAPYNQDFEGLVQADPAALANDGWLVTGNVFDAAGNFIYFYGGVFPAPNGGAAFSAIASGEGGPDQGAQQLSIYSDYNNPDHGNGLFIEANVWQEQIVGAADVGNTWRFSFDHKRGNIEGQTTADAFIKTLDPNNGFALTNFITADMTNITDQWGRTSLTITIDPSLEGQILQIGFLSLATAFEGSGIFYDNINWREQDPLYVTLSSFSAQMTRDGVLVSWRTAMEIDTVAFRVLRESGNREKTLVNLGTILASGTEFNGAAYELYDTERVGGNVLYYLEDVDSSGRVTRHGPVELIRPSGGRGGRGR